MDAVTEHKETLYTLSGGLRLRLCERRTDGDYPKSDQNTLLVIDDRLAADPSFRIVDSYRVVRRRQKREVLLALADYAKNHPSTGKWQRTVASMEKEWVIHNVAYRFGLFQEQTRDVDLNNGEENSSWRHFFFRGIGVLLRKVMRMRKKSGR